MVIMDEWMDGCERCIDFLFSISRAHTQKALTVACENVQMFVMVDRIHGTDTEGPRVARDGVLACLYSNFSISCHELIRTGLGLIISSCSSVTRLFVVKGSW